VEAVIALEYKEGSGSLSDIKPDSPCLIIGQKNPFEHNNPAFVEDVCMIEVLTGPCGKWEAPSVFPAQGDIEAGETVKLQHGSIGTVKIFYTLDGSEPTVFSKMYNPSTYQPELNVPIPIEEDTQIRAMASGYGREDSDAVTFFFRAVK